MINVKIDMPRAILLLGGYFSRHNRVGFFFIEPPCSIVSTILYSIQDRIQQDFVVQYTIRYVWQSIQYILNTALSRLSRKNEKKKKAWWGTFRKLAARPKKPGNSGPSEKNPQHGRKKNRPAWLPRKAQKNGKSRIFLVFALFSVALRACFCCVACFPGLRVQFLVCYIAYRITYSRICSILQHAVYGMYSGA